MGRLALLPWLSRLFLLAINALWALAQATMVPEGRPIRSGQLCGIL